MTFGDLSLILPIDTIPVAFTWVADCFSMHPGYGIAIGMHLSRLCVFLGNDGNMRISGSKGVSAVPRQQPPVTNFGRCSIFPLLPLRHQMEHEAGQTRECHSLTTGGL